MSKQDHLRRAALRDPRAAAAARRREQEDPMEEARRRVREHRVPPSVVLFVDGVAEQHRRVGRREHVFMGYGDGTDAERAARRRRPVGQPRHPARNPTLTEVTGMSRRTMMRAKKLVVALGILECQTGGPADKVTGLPRTRQRAYPTGHRGRDLSTATGSRTHVIGVGGCGPGGIGWANAYWLPGGPPPAPALPPRPQLAGPERIGVGRYGQLVDHVRAQQTSPPAPARGP